MIGVFYCDKQKLASLWFVLALSTWLLPDVKAVLFSSPVKYTKVTSPVQTFTQNVSSNTKCAILCAQNITCLTFYFNAANNSCTISDAVIEASMGTVFGPGVRDCPGNIGYEIYSGVNMYLCLKVVSTNMNRPSAAERCTIDSGHLLLIQDEEMHSFVRSILVDLKSADVWIDGEDFDGSKHYMSWRNEILPYLGWSKYDPDEIGHMCVRLMKSLSYTYGDKNCSRLYKSICQIDLW